MIQRNGIPFLFKIQKSDLKAFMEKLVEKGQELDLGRQVHRAVSIFHEKTPLSQAKSNDGLLTDAHNMLTI